MKKDEKGKNRLTEPITLIGTFTVLTQDTEVLASRRIIVDTTVLDYPLAHRGFMDDAHTAARDVVTEVLEKSLAVLSVGSLVEAMGQLIGVMKVLAEDEEDKDE